MISEFLGTCLRRSRVVVPSVGRSVQHCSVVSYVVGRLDVGVAAGFVIISGIILIFGVEFVCINCDSYLFVVVEGFL